MSLSSLAGPRGYYLAVALAVVISLPTLGFGFFVDDYVHLATVEGHNAMGSPWDIFVFGTGDREEMRPYLEAGPFPWFMDPEFKGHFFRPLSSLAMALDYKLFGHSAPPHFMSIRSCGMPCFAWAPC